MEVKGAALLYTLAGLMITFAGFSALLLAVRPAAGARLSMLDRYLAKTVMTYVFGFVVALEVIMQQPIDGSERQTRPSGMSAR
jgi:hypothetical protein